MPFLGRFFGTDPAVRDSQLRDAVACAAEGLDIQAAVAAHRQWKQQLQAQLRSPAAAPPVGGVPALDREQVCRDDRCDLGRWIHGRGRARLGTFPGFTELLAHHRMFHHVAGNVLALQAAGEHAAARRMLHDQFEDYSQRVTEDLRLLQRVASETDLPRPA